MEDVGQMTTSSEIFLWVLGALFVIFLIAVAVTLVLLIPAKNMAYIFETDFASGFWLLMIIHTVAGAFFYFNIYSSIPIMLWWMAGYTVILNGVLGGIAWLKEFG